ncbi:hypothetical protein NC652_013070 [Populus alba x Populus x berolinensis]|nr:hypothetical protein NC652_013070 [Populus alba x Populus x berolinensis]
MLQPLLKHEKKNGILIYYTLKNGIFIALYNLNTEHCPIPTRTVQKIADALKAGSVLAKLSIGDVNPISGNAIVNLLLKLAIWKRFISTKQNIVKYFSSIYL